MKLIIMLIIYVHQFLQSMISLLYKSNKVKEKIKEKWLGMNGNKVVDSFWLTTTANK